MPRIKIALAALLASTFLSGCSTMLDKIENAGKLPPMSDVHNPNETPSHEQISWPLPENQPAPKQYANSLWQPGARAFFRDGRAARVGDVLRVSININDQAQLNNQTQAQRTSTNSLAAPSLFGLQDKVKILSPVASPGNLISTNSNINTQGTGNAKRQEIVTTQVAALITQILPNGNFVIEGSSEMEIDNDIREVSVKGVIRPQDIKSDNTIDSTQVAEARITYSGRGQLMDMLQPAWGTQVLTAISPF